MDPKCYTYISLKNPQLTSLGITLLFTLNVLDEYLPFSSAIYDMITKLILLKKLSIEVSGGIKKGKYIFPHREFLRWLNDHPKQLTYISYPNPLLQS